MIVFAQTYFTDPSGIQYRLDFLKKQATGGIKEIKGTRSPFQLKLPSIKHKFQVVYGSGCKISLNSATDRELLELYTIRMQDIQLRFYQDNKMIWCGWLDSELYEEDYCAFRNYPVQLTGNDGLNILSRLTFIKEDGNLYNGEMKIFDLIKLIIGKMALPYKKLYLLCPTKAVISESLKLNALEHLSVLTDNYLDKDNKPLSLREVLEEILKPFGAQIKCSGGNIWILDTHHEAQKGVVQAICYDIEDNWKRSEVTVNLIKDISAIGFFQTGGTLKKLSGYNEQEITYTPKVISTLGAPKVEDPKMWDNPPEYVFWKSGRSFTYKGHPGSHTQILYEHLKKSTGNTMKKYIKFLNDNADLQGIKSTGTDKEEPQESTYLALINPYYNKNRPSTYKPQWSVEYRPHQYIIGNSSTLLRISFEAFILTSDNPFDDERSTIKQLRIPIKVSIGGKPIDLELNEEGSENSYIYGVIHNPKTREDVSEKWTKAQGLFYVIRNNVSFRESKAVISDTGIVMNIPSDFSGDLVISFASNIQTFTSVGRIQMDDNYKQVKEVQIKDLKVELVKRKGNSTEFSPVKSDDITYTGKMNHYFKEKGKEIKVIHGTSISAGEKGAFIYRDGDTGTIINTYEKAGVTNKIEKLLLRSIMSNYKRAHLGLTSIRLKNNLMIHQTITDSRILGNKAFIISGGTIDYYQGCADVSLVEVFEDTEEIVDIQSDEQGNNQNNTPSTGGSSTTGGGGGGRGRQH